MRTIAVKNELNTYLALLSSKQKQLILDMVKSILHVDASEKRISRKQYNRELLKSENEIKRGKYIAQEDLEKESLKW